MPSRTTEVTLFELSDFTVRVRVSRSLWWRMQMSLLLLRVATWLIGGKTVVEEEDEHVVGEGGDAAGVSGAEQRRMGEVAE